MKQFKIESVVLKEIKTIYDLFNELLDLPFESSLGPNETHLFNISKKIDKKFNQLILKLEGQIKK